MSIVLLNIPPKTIEERRYDKPNYPDPRLGALFSYLQRHNVECDIIDSRLERLTLKEIIKRLEAIKPRAMGFSSFTPEVERVSCAANVIKKKFPDAKLIIGGAHASALPKRTLSEFSVFDISVFGEGEQTMLNLVENNFENLTKVQGIAYRKGKDIIVNKPRPSLNMTEIPAIDWNRFPKARYYPVFTSRGCPYSCVFCSRPFGRKVRYRPIDSIIEEIRRIKKLFNPKYIYFWDENFTTDKNRTFALLENIRNDRVIKDIKWYCQAHVNNLDYELLKAMKRSGCLRIGIGIESGSEKILSSIGKAITKEKIIQAVAWIKKLKMPYEGYFLLGLPNENRNTCMETIRFATKLNPNFPVFGIPAPYPGTKIYNMALQGEGGYKIISRRWKDYNKILGNAMELEGLSRRRLQILQLYGYVSVLLKNFRILDMLRFIFQFNEDIMSGIKIFFKKRTPA